MLFLHPLNKIRELARQQIGTGVRYTFDSLPSRSQYMQHLLKVARRSLKSKAPILITGEDGVGKSTLAMALHNESEYRTGPFISVNCRSVSSVEMAREILGYDWDQGQPSKFELAHGGTLYLEKVEYLTGELQSVLLKILKTRLFSRSDSQRLIPVHFQLITSSSASLDTYVEKQAFNRQLYYDISTNELHITPLRERREDIRMLTEQIVADYARRHNTTLTLSPEVIEKLTSCPWQGNTPELKNRLERLLLNRSGNRISLPDLPDDLHFPATPSARSHSGHADPGIQPLEALEKQAIINAWHTFDGKMGAMAKALQIGRTTLWRKIDKYGLAEKFSR